MTNFMINSKSFLSKNDDKKTNVFSNLEIFNNAIL